MSMTIKNSSTAGARAEAGPHNKLLAPAAALLFRAAMKRSAYSLAAICMLMLTASVSRAETYQIISTENSVVAGDLTKTVTTIQVGINPMDKFKMTKVAKNLPAHAFQAALVVLPPLGSGFQNYEVGDDGDYNNSFAGFFARRNFVVFGYSQRVQDLVAGTCESGAADCSAMANWGLDRIVKDVAIIRELIELDFPNLKKIVGGLSLGSIAAAATIDAHPGDYDGAILIDGTIYDENPEVQAINANFCAGFEFLLDAGVLYDGQGAPGFKLLSNLAVVDPNGLTPLPGFPPGFTNRQAFLAVMTTPSVTPLGPRPGFYQTAGSVAEDRLFYAKESLVHASVAEFVNYTTTRIMLDLTCGLAGDRTFTGNLDSFSGPVIMFAAGHGFGSAMIDTAQLMTSANVTLNFNELFGHVDYVFSQDHLHQIEHPILNWLQRDVLK